VWLQRRLRGQHGGLHHLHAGRDQTQDSRTWHCRSYPLSLGFDQPLAGSVGHYRPHAQSPGGKCSSCDIEGVTCDRNATLATFNLAHGRWRLSTLTIQTHYCKRGENGWTLCRGGAQAGSEGEGCARALLESHAASYNPARACPEDLSHALWLSALDPFAADCEPGYKGPRCEVCSGEKYSRYLDKLDVRCHDCASVTARSTGIACTVLVLILILAGIVAATNTKERLRQSRSRAFSAVPKKVHSASKIWRRAGMQFKVCPEPFLEIF
jgi:hypothetical protein